MLKIRSLNPMAGYCASSCRIRFSIGRVAIVCCLILGASEFMCAAQPSVEYALGLKPKQFVEYDIPSEQEAKVATLAMEKTNGMTSWVVRSAEGILLRRFADTNGNRVVDQWSYCKDGLEVYRDIDTDHNTKPDQCRWFGVAGSRWGIDANEDGAIDEWKVLSPEEATAEIVRALANREPAIFNRLLPSSAELEGVGFSEELFAQVSTQVTDAKKLFEALSREQKEVTLQTQWTAMLAGLPGVIPKSPDGATADITAYDNVVALTEVAGGGGGQIFVGSLVRFGSVWRPLALPQLSSGSGTVTESLSIFSPRMDSAALQAGTESETLQPFLEQLRIIEQEMQKAERADLAELITKQVRILDDVSKRAEGDEKEFWLRQLAETLAAAAQEGTMPNALGELEELSEKLPADEPLKSFLAFRLASARYATRMQDKDADIEKVQAAWLEELTAFVEVFPEAQDAAEASLQISIADEFSGREESAIQRYQQIVNNFPSSASARKASGALRRLKAVGQPLNLSGTTIDGQKISLQQFKGKPVLVHYWATWCEPCKVDIARIRELQEKYQRDIVVVGIALDENKSALQQFLAKKPLNWPQLFEPGGLDGRLAEDLGVLTLPTMLLIDKEGIVVERNILVTDLENKLKEVVAN
ncbi:MAG: thioredoxin [Planctomycetaceae bacterium]|nr:thioredoxin [Planctomycetaceae bacterium]